MPYATNLSENQRVTIANIGNQTNISLVSKSPQQQQSQSSSFTTGVWQTPPQLYQVGLSFILKLSSDQGTSYVSIQAQGISTIAAPSLDNAVEVDLQKVDDSATGNSVKFEPMQSMKPMQPMKMGNMSMDINSMSMEMGNMSLNMNNSQTSTTKVFCSQCGREAKPSDSLFVKVAVIS